MSEVNKATVLKKEESVNSDLKQADIKIKKSGKVPIYLNGRLIGYCDDGETVANIIIEKRRLGLISHELNVAFHREENELYLYCDQGRARRPYIIVENGKSKLTPAVIEQIKKGELSWTKLLKLGIIEYLDAEEEDHHAYVAQSEEELTPEHTHLEIAPVSILGVVASMLPYAEYNSSPRITMACSMAKQALGTYALNHLIRMDSRAHVMFYPQEPLVKTIPYEILGMSERAAGQNFIVAVTSFYGYNMSDAVIVNKSAIDRGLGRSLFFKAYEIEERRYPGGQKDRFCIPPVGITGHRGEEAYRHLEEDGIIYPSADVNAGDVLVGKVSPPRFLEEINVFGVVEEKERESSLYMKTGDKGTVDSVLYTTSVSGNVLVKVRTYSLKIPEIGDKFASRHGQKGVIGMVVRQEDMPFTKEGIVPDLILNPHAIPSRMTVGHILEMLGGTAKCLSGKEIDGTTFSGTKEEEIRAILREYNFDEFGETELYDGYTGKKIKAKIFVGVIYYQKLHHLVSNKMHMRSRGPVQLLTHQPTEGRAREGGLRFGEMERDCLIGYGASMLIRERMLEESDKTQQLICVDCGYFAIHDYARNIDYCPLCKSNNIETVEMSYAFKLLVDEIKSLGIFPKIVLRDKA
ncbi:MAG: DNA-directed RNA polymerase subunit B [Candidatus Micrarchaeota archaeon]|nr:DNA-directed RNA polymerase subunit B [Candidatus Micrarchaeota archaeon]